MKTREERLAYQKGYSTGITGRWPSHKPPYPPCEVVAELVKASRELRDAADGLCATLTPEDEFSQALEPRIDRLDEALQKVTAWLAEKPHE